MPDTINVILSDDMVNVAGTQTGPLTPEESRKAAPLTDAEALLRALRNVIIPLVRPGDGESTRDSNEIELGPDGEEFVNALQKFMGSFLRSQRGSVGGLEVEIKERGAEILNAGSPASNTSHDDPTPNYAAAVSPDTAGISSAKWHMKSEEDFQRHRAWRVVHNQEFPDMSAVFGRDSVKVEEKFEEGRLRLLEKLRNVLQEHVFSVMPIRLLCFKPYASKLHITLVERGTIYGDIVSTLETNVFDPEFSPQRIASGNGSYSVENEEDVIKRLIRKYSRYAILSHTWLRGASGEVTYGDWSLKEFDPKQPGYCKLVKFCQTAWEDHEVTFGWMDTVCINKESSAELDESIRSMYKWYSSAYVCITYLAETVALSDMPNDTWFTRGWTLQELIAPSHIKFYNMHWNKLIESLKSDKEDIVIWTNIKQATTITGYELGEPITSLPISRRMQMAATRQVTRQEDSAYCLMGIFDVSISIAYGEGSERAFSRLLKKILNSSTSVLDMFNWAGSRGTRISSLLPPSPQGYLRRSWQERMELEKKPIEPPTFTHLGLRVTIVLMPAISIQNLTSSYDPIGDYHAIADISPLAGDSAIIHGMVEWSYSVLDDRSFGSDGWNKKKNWFKLTLGILNVGDGADGKIMVPKHCLAVGLNFYRDLPIKIPTEAPIIFTLDRRRNSYGGKSEPMDYFAWHNCYYIDRSELASHGMKLVTLFL